MQRSWEGKKYNDILDVIVANDRAIRVLLEKIKSHIQYLKKAEPEYRFQKTELMRDFEIQMRDITALADEMVTFKDNDIDQNSDHFKKAMRFFSLYEAIIPEMKRVGDELSKKAKPYKVFMDVNTRANELANVHRETMRNIAELAKFESAFGEEGGALRNAFTQMIKLAYALGKKYSLYPRPDWLETFSSEPTPSTSLNFKINVDRFNEYLSDVNKLAVLAVLVIEVDKKNNSSIQDQLKTNVNSQKKKEMKLSEEKRKLPANFDKNMLEDSIRVVQALPRFNLLLEGILGTLEEFKGNMKDKPAAFHENLDTMIQQSGMLQVKPAVVEATSNINKLVARGAAVKLDFDAKLKSQDAKKRSREEIDRDINDACEASNFLTKDIKLDIAMLVASMRAEELFHQKAKTVPSKTVSTPVLGAQAARPSKVGHFSLQAAGHRKGKPMHTAKSDPLPGPTPPAVDRSKPLPRSSGSSSPVKPSRPAPLPPAAPSQQGQFKPAANKTPPPAVDRSKPLPRKK